jgi:hypothetical protein
MARLLGAQDAAAMRGDRQKRGGQQVASVESGRNQTGD